MRVLKAVVFSTTIGNEPGHLVRFVSRVVFHLVEWHLLVTVVVVDPLLVGRHNIAVGTVSGRPVEDVVVSYVLRVIWTLQEI
jgi:hypothetical protein